MGTIDSSGSLSGRNDNAKMMRHVLAMAGASAALAVSLQIAAVQPQYAYAEETSVQLTEQADGRLAATDDSVLRAEVDENGEIAESVLPADDAQGATAPADSKDLANADVSPGSPTSEETETDPQPSAPAEAAKDSESSESGEAAIKPAPIPDKVEDGAYTIVSALGKTLEISGAATDDGGNAQTWNDNNSAAQRFHIKAEGQAASGEWYYSITNVNSGKVLDCVGGRTESGTNVQQWSANGTGAQQWFLRTVTDASGNTYYQIVNVKSGLVLDVSGANTAAGANVQIYASNGTAAQRWLLKKQIREVADGAYTIVSGLDSSYAIDISGASGDDCAAAQIYGANGTLAQTFAINYDDYSGYYTITNYASGKKLDVAAGSTQAGALVQQYGANGTRAQLWNIVKHSDGSVTFISAINGHALDVMWASAQNGTRLQQWDSNNSAAQRFFLKEAHPSFTGGLVEIRNGANGYVVMDVPGASKDAGASIQLYEQNKTFAQKYQVESDGAGAFYIRNLASGLYISANADGLVSQQNMGGSYVQSWIITPTEDGHFALSLVGGSGYLGVAKSAAGSVLSLTTGGLASSWNFVKAALLESGLYTIASAVDARYVLDVSGASLANCGNVQLWESNGTNAQKFYVQRIDGDIYSITNAWSALAVDVSGAAAQSGTNIQQYASNGTNAQKWIATWDGRGGIVFKSALGDYALATSGAYSGSNAALSKFDVENDCQRFTLSATSFAFASMSDRIDVLDNIGGWGMSVFKSLKGVSGQTWNDLWGAVSNYTNDGKAVGFIMMDLTTGAGVSYNCDDNFWSASTIKGPYVAALNMYMPWVLDSWAGTMHETILNSSNETYASLRYAFGADPMYRIAQETHAWDFNWDAWYTYYSPRTLAKLWTGMADYFMSERQNAWWCRDVYGSNNWITSRPTLSWKGCTIYAKSGWVYGGPTAHNEGCLVMDGDHPYLMVVMSNELSDNSWKMSNLMSVLDRAHSELI